MDVGFEIPLCSMQLVPPSVRSVNALMTATYWEIGRRIVESGAAGSGEESSMPSIKPCSPNEKLIAEELERSRLQLEKRRPRLNQQH